MALIFADSRCAICGEALDRPYTATSGCAFEQTHHLWQFCDAPLHFDCLSKWPNRREFSHGYFRASIEAYRSGASGTLIHETDSWFLACGPVVGDDKIAPLLGSQPGVPAFAEIRLSSWPIRLYSKWRDWAEFLEGDYRCGLVGEALASADQIVEQVRSLAPTCDALWDARAASIARDVRMRE